MELLHAVQMPVQDPPWRVIKVSDGDPDQEAHGKLDGGLRRDFDHGGKVAFEESSHAALLIDLLGTACSAMRALQMSSALIWAMA